MPPLDPAPVRRPEYVTRAIAGETLIVPVRKNVGDLDSIYVLNEVGTAIWERIDGRNTPRDIAMAITAEFEVEEDLAAKDVGEFLREIRAAGLLSDPGEADG
jgi:hypothetical protein